MADVVPGVAEARLAVVGLLRHHAVEPDVAAGEPRHAGAPDLDAVALSAHRRPGDVEAEEAEAWPYLTTEMQVTGSPSSRPIRKPPGSVA